MNIIILYNTTTSTIRYFIFNIKKWIPNFLECAKLRENESFSPTFPLWEKLFSHSDNIVQHKRQQENTQRKFNYAKRKYKNICQDFSMQKLCNKSEQAGELPLRQILLGLPLLFISRDFETQDYTLWQSLWLILSLSLQVFMTESDGI